MYDFIADEGIDKHLVDALRSSKFSVLYIAEEYPGIDDEQVLEISNQNKSLLLTADKDFGELVFRQKLIHHGVMLIRLFGIDSEGKASIVVKTIQKHLPDLEENFSVLTKDSLRIRKTFNT